MITNLSITANDLINVCNSAPVRKNANSQPLVIVFAGQENVILTLNDDDHDDDCQKDTDDKNTEPAICPSPCPFEVVHHVSGTQVVKLQNIFLMTEPELG